MSPYREPPKFDYDPLTCVTASELRALGYAVPESVPDEAWAPLSEVRVELVKRTFASSPLVVLQYRIQADMRSESPFRTSWIQRISERLRGLR